MASFHQLGHHCINLINNGMTGPFGGAILSPVNYNEAQTASHVERFQTESFECILDPQLYVPTSSRGQLPNWSYFPSDVDTADLSSAQWWQSLNLSLAESLSTINAKTVAAPCVVPSTYSTDYFNFLVSVGDNLRSLVPANRQVLLTVVVKLEDLKEAERSFELASILSRTRADGIYLVFYSQKHSRQELDDSVALSGAVKLVSSLSIAKLRVLVGYCGTDLVLWKHAGARDCATGKFWNLRRFGPERWQEASQDGDGQLPYWLEPSLLAYLREGDLVRLDDQGLIPQSSKETPTAAAIIHHREESPGKAWVRLGWLQYMRWFSYYEATPHPGYSDLQEYLRAVEANWEHLQDSGFLMEEPRNDGRWVRPWRIAANSAFSE